MEQFALRRVGFGLLPEGPHPRILHREKRRDGTDLVGNAFDQTRDEHARDLGIRRDPRQGPAHAGQAARLVDGT